MKKSSAASDAMRESARNLEADAAEWVIRIDRGLAPHEREALERWLDGDTRRKGALARAQAVWLQAERARVYRNEITLSDPRTHVDAVEHHGRVRGWVWWAAAAAMLVIGLPGTYLAWQSYETHHLATIVGEIRAIPLEDGSRVTLDTATRVAVRFQRSTRVVQLESGMAQFVVMKDPTRPFVVFAGHTRVRAIGTAFMVRVRSDDNVEVTVTQGAVDVWRDNSGPEPAIRLEAGNRTLTTAAEIEPPQSLTGAQLAGATAWEEGVIDLNGRSLGEAAREFNRYNRQTVVINDARLAAQTTVGRFQADNPLAFVNAAAAMLGARVRVEGDRLILEPGAP
jgi:transmembrane sensor